MSQRTWRTKSGVEIMTGWDRPLGYFFLTIIDGVDKDGEDNTVFCNLDKYPFPGGMTVIQVEKELNERNIKYPASMFNDLHGDMRRDVGNLSKDYGVL